jgi:short-subunit dehydrogenase
MEVVIPVMRKQGGGIIVNITSLGGIQALYLQGVKIEEEFSCIFRF